MSRKVWNHLIILRADTSLTSSQNIVSDVLLQSQNVVCENAKNNGLKHKELPHSVSEWVPVILLLRAILGGMCFSAPLRAAFSAC